MRLGENQQLLLGPCIFLKRFLFPLLRTHEISVIIFLRNDQTTTHQSINPSYHTLPFLPLPNFQCSSLGIWQIRKRTKAYFGTRETYGYKSCLSFFIDSCPVFSDGEEETAAAEEDIKANGTCLPLIAPKGSETTASSEHSRHFLR